MNIDNLTGEAIKSIKLSNPEKLFSGDSVEIKKIYKRLSVKWHPDRNANNIYAGQVFTHINLLYKQAIKKFNSKIGSDERAIRIKSFDGKDFIFRYLKEKDFEMGKYFIAHGYILWRFNIEYKDMVLSGLNNVKNIRYADNKMKDSFLKYIPIIEKTIESDDYFFVLIKKDKKFLNLGDVLEFSHNKIDSKHAAWILSTIYNHTCFIHYNSLMHGGINLDNYYINPETHEGILLGGWWYSNVFDSHLVALSQDAIDVAPVSLLNNKKANYLLDLEMIKKLGRRLLGDVSGMYLNKDKDIPTPLIKWLRDGSKGSAVEQYTEWNKDILPNSFGKRKFVVMNINSDNLYREV